MSTGGAIAADGANPAVSEPAAELSLDRLVAVNLGWGLLTQVTTRVLLAVTGIVLARILTPSDYGVFAVAVITMELLLGINDLGLMTAISRHQGEVARVARTATSLAAVASVALYALSFAIAPWIAAALNVPTATTVLRVAALVVLIDGFCAVPAALLTRAFRQDRRALADVAGVVAYVAVSIVLAKNGNGVWSLVLGRMAGTAITAGLVIALAPLRPWPGFDRGEASELLRFGLPVSGAGLLSLLLLNLDYIVVGRLLGPFQLGLYVVAFNLCTWPFQLVFLAVQRVSVVGFARLAGNRRALNAGFNRSMALLAAVILPACIAIGLLAGPLVRIVYGERWSPAADALRFLAVFGGVRVLEALVENFLAGVGRSVTIVWIAAAWLVTLIPAIVVGARLGGIQGVGAAHAVVATVVVLPLALLATRPSGVDLGPWLRQLPRLGSAAAAAAAGILLVEWVRPGDVPRLLAGGAVGVVAYALVAMTWPSLRALLSSQPV
jgi:PST family polysaccharide transporter